MSFDGRLYDAGIAFAHVDPELAIIPMANASSPFQISSEFSLEMYPTTTMFIYNNIVAAPDSNFAPQTLQDFTRFFTPATLTATGLPLTTKLVAAEQEYERVIARSCTLNQIQMRISLEFVYPSSSDMNANAHPLEVELMLYVKTNANTQFLHTAYSFFQLLSAQSWNSQIVHGVHIRLYWLFVAVAATILVGVIIWLYFYVRAKRNQNNSDERLFDERK